MFGQKAKRMEDAVFLLSLLTIGCTQPQETDTNRRFLAQMLMKQEYLSPPQSEDCSIRVEIPSIKYGTLSVNLKDLHLQSRLRADITWVDPELAWNTTMFPYDRVMLPVDKVWTPDLTIENGKSYMEHGSKNLLVYSNGTVWHKVAIFADVTCEINLFNYPFAYDVCPIGLTSTPPDGCGISIYVGNVTLTEKSHGDWQTEEVWLRNSRIDRTYIEVSLKLKNTNPFITLLLPTILIMVADIFSSALPLQGGERNSFKVTLVLSFTMFLNILNDELPGDTECSPLIRIHFCICQVLMMISMIVSIVLTKIGQDGGVFFTCSYKRSAFQNAGGNKEDKDADANGDISVIQSDVSKDSQILQKMGRFLEDAEAKQGESERPQKLAEKLDKIFFWLYLILNTGYLCTMLLVMNRYECKVNHLYFW